MIRKSTLALSLALMSFTCFSSQAEDWPAFRGQGGSASATATLPTAWSSKANLGWKTEMPGPGASSPIIVDGKAFVTCYSGYGLTKEEPGEIENLVRHLVCIDMETGKKLWQKDVKVTLPEDPYSGIGVTAHGYASHTPVSDGKNVYAFFGKSGVHAFDMEGNKLWNAEVGKESDPAKWGSSSSPVIYKNIVIVTASAESQAIIGLDRESGKEIWRQEAEGLDGMWGTPSLVKVDDARTDLVMCVAKELWGLDPSNGKMRWFADATGAQQAYSSLVQNGKRIYAFTGRGGGSIALDVGGMGDVSEANTVWTGRDTGSFSSPVGHKNKLYIVNRGIATVVDASTGERVEQVRLKGVKQTGGNFGSLDYPSPVVAGDHMYYLNGGGQMFVFKLGDKMEQVAINEVTSDKETFWGTPAVSENKMILRSSKHVYCVVDKGEKVDPSEAMLAQNDAPAAGGRPSGGRPSGGGGRPSAGGGGRPGGASGGGGGSRDPMAFFNGMDTDKDGMVTSKELEGNRMADRLKTLDKDKDGSISKDEYSSGIGALFSRGGGGGGSRGGGGGGGGGGYGNRGEDTRPDRPQRPEMVEKK